MKRSGYAALFLGLFLLFLTALLPLQEAQAATEITSVSVTITAPAAGTRPSYNPALPSGAHYASAAYNQGYYQNGVAWFDTTGNTDLVPGTDSFRANHYYAVRILLSPWNGYSFSYNMTVQVNKNTPSWMITQDGNLEIYYTFPGLRQSISSVSLTVKAPKGGASPDYSPVTPSKAKYLPDTYRYNKQEESKVTWFDLTDQRVLVPGTDKYKTGHVYEVSVYLVPTDGYTFGKDITAKVNGSTAYADCVSDRCFVSCTFPETAPAPTLSSVSFPKKKATVGQKAAITAVTSTTVNKLSMYSGSKLIKSWTDGYTDSGTKRTWKVTYAFSAAGDKTMTFKGTDPDGTVTAGKKASITVAAKPTLKSVSFPKEKATVGQKAAITAVTSVNVTKLSMYNGSKLIKSWTGGYTDSGSTRTWEVTYAFSVEGNKTMTFKGTDANGAVTAGKTAGITITPKPTLSGVSFSETKMMEGQEAPITAVTSTTVIKLNMYRGSTRVKSWTKGYTDSGTIRIWKVAYAFSVEGDKTMTFTGTDANGAVTEGKTAVITITANSTLSGVSFSETNVAIGQKVTITAVTSTAVTKLSMYSGSKLVKSWTKGYTDSGTTRIWKVTYTFSDEGTKTLTFKGLDANGTVLGSKDAAITVTADDSDLPAEG